MRSGSIDSIAGTEAERSDLRQSSEAAPAAVTAADDGPAPRDDAANGTVNGVGHLDTHQPDKGAALNGRNPGDGKSGARHFRRYSTGEDFEASAGPRGKDSYGDAADTQHVGAGSRWYDPRKDVVLRIECATDAQSKVRGVSLLRMHLMRRSRLRYTYCVCVHVAPCASSLSSSPVRVSGRKPVCMHCCTYWRRQSFAPL